MPNFNLLAPEIFLSGMACVVLLVDLYLSDERRHISYLLAQVALAGTAILAWQGLAIAPQHTFEGMFVHDTMSSVLKIMMSLVVFFVFAYSREYLRDRNMFRGEYFVLGLFGVVGMMVMASASHFLTLYLGLELMSLCLYAMTAMQRDSGTATEAAMKYFVLGALASGMLLYGMSMLYGVTGSLNIAEVQAKVSLLDIKTNMPMVLGLVFVVVALAFKLGAVPFHMWVPDVYHGAPTSVAAYISSAPKLAAFAMIMRLLVDGLAGLVADWQSMLIILAILSMATGNLIAIAQTNIKRMLAYSAISHMGFFLLGIVSAGPNGYSSSMIYVLAYAAMSMAAFGMVMLLSRKGFEADNLEDFKGLNQRSPWYAFIMLVLMFSMAGVPPTAGFYAKLMVVQSVIDSGMLWLALTAVLFAVVGAFYYLRVIKLMYFDDPVADAPIAPRPAVAALMSVNVMALLLAMLFAGQLTELCRSAIAAL
ncbi:MAG: NADH-quinone oxidoreductase subunit NuoN [Gammaproteobacteria bacterium]|nr:NADH-quinone oxidoreductase subunit NuoN [Gammaproteobacteria bacterium]